MKDRFRYPGKSSSDVLSLVRVPREYVWKAGRVVPVVVFSVMDWRRITWSHLVMWRRAPAGTESRCRPMLPARTDVSGANQYGSGSQHHQRDVHDER